MPAELEVLGKLHEIGDRLNAIEHTQELLVRAEGRNILPIIWQATDDDETLARVYLQVDGERTQNQIAEALKEMGVPGGTPGTVSKKLDILRDLDLVRLVRQSRQGKVYRRTDCDRILGIARQLERRLAKKTKRGEREAT